MMHHLMVYNYCSAALPAGEVPSPLLANDAVVLGLLLGVLALIFWTSESNHPVFKKFYRYVPALLLCYFIPGLLGTLNLR